jgi:hypothetical protein
MHGDLLLWTATRAAAATCAFQSKEYLVLGNLLYQKNGQHQEIDRPLALT